MWIEAPRTKIDRGRLAIPVVFLLLYATAVFFRPALPIDETRYLSVAWEMWLRGDWLAPLTVNFEPYHHKPPLLFWMINASWSVFGVSRWAASIPVVLAALSATILTGSLCKRLLPALQSRAQTVFVGSFGFLLYATVILFDLTLTVFVVGALLCLISYARLHAIRTMVFMGVLLGLGVLTKGPVTYLYVIFPIVLGPYWAAELRDRKRWYLGNLLAFLVSLLPVLAWLVPVLGASSNEFGHWLVWEQTAGRVTGAYAGAHARPLYFYALMLPLLLVPWIFLPRLWKGLAAATRGVGDRSEIRFLVSWVVPTFAAFSLIGGKQPHYLVPLLPGIAILVALALNDVATRRLTTVAAVMVIGFIAANAGFSATIRDQFDLAPVAAFIDSHRDHSVAFAGGHYRGEFNFLARLDEPIDTPGTEDIEAWFASHPHGIAVIRYRSADEVSRYEQIVTRPYRGKRIGIFANPSDRRLARR